MNSTTTSIIILYKIAGNISKIRIRNNLFMKVGSVISCCNGCFSFGRSRNLLEYSIITPLKVFHIFT